MARDWKGAYAGMHARGEADFPPACLYYVLQLNRQISRERSGRPMTPEELTEYFRKRIRIDFGPLANRVLQEWGPTPEHLGRAVVLLGRHGCLKLDATDTAASFAADSRSFID